MAYFLLMYVSYKIYEAVNIIKNSELYDNLTTLAGYRIKSV